MSAIHLLDAATIDKIAAGEVVERPASVVKELVENAIDAGASVIQIEITDGGIQLIRVTDNGSGIDHDDIPTAFLRHATSKIENADDLMRLHSLGFRGEALASIAAVSKTEMISKTADCDYAVCYRIDGGVEVSCEKTGAPNGTSVTVRQLFYNVPVRRRFLKTPVSEAVRVHEIVMNQAMSHPEISFSFVTNGQVKIHTSGSGDVLETATRVYGIEFGREMLPVSAETEGLTISGYIGSPALSRGNRKFETFFVNGRSVSSETAQKALEEAYRGYTMQHRFPVCVLYLQIAPDAVDMNIHPTKSRVRLADRISVYQMVYSACLQTLKTGGRVPTLTVEEPAEQNEKRIEQKENDKLDYFMNQMRERVMAYHHEEVPKAKAKPDTEVVKKIIKEQREADGQISLFQHNARVDQTNRRYHLIGQLFDTYWLVESDETLYIVDQHAAHEKVLYEQTMESLRNKEYTTQMVSPPIIMNVSEREEQVLKDRLSDLERIGYEIEPFGDHSWAVTGVPGNMFSIAQETLLRELIDDLSEDLPAKAAPDVILEYIASASCKAAIKGNTVMNADQMNGLLVKLFALDNPFHCPHGRPTMIAMTHRDLDKKFKRIV